MINGYLEQFLDTGWFSESTLFLNDIIYFCAAYSTDNKYEFTVHKWRAVNEDNKYFHSVCDNDVLLDWACIYEDSGCDLDLIKKRFLEAKIFDDKSFWEVEQELAWLDESTPIMKDSGS